MLFKVKRGTHYRDGKVYKKGDKIETSLDLVTMYGEQRFERDYEAEQRTSTIANSKPNIPPPVDKGEDEVEEIKSEPLSYGEYGEDVTLEFPTAEKVEVMVFEKSKWYTVVDRADSEILNEKKLRRKDVEPFLKQYLDNDEKDIDDKDIDDEG